MEIKHINLRQVYFRDEKILVKTISTPTNYNNDLLCKWSNCLYMEFRKEDYPHFDYNTDYYRSSFADLSFHGGITYYQERLVNKQYTTIEIGCDYQHLYDDLTWGREDNGERILRGEAQRLVKEFVNMHNKIKEGEYVRDNL